MTVTGLPPASGSGLDLATRTMSVPHAATAAPATIPIRGGRFTVPAGRYRPTVLIRLRIDLEATRLTLDLTSSGGAATGIAFEPYSAAGSVLLVTATDPGADGIAGALEYQVELRLASGNAAFDSGRRGRLVRNSAIEAWFEALVIDGNTARVALLLDLEKQRLLRQARELHIMKGLGAARSCMLDGIGADLKVPRLVNPVDGEREPDNRYRRRLAIYRDRHLATPAGLELLLNGDGEDLAGLPAGFGVHDRFRIIEEDNPLHVAFALVSVGDVDDHYDNLQHQVCRRHLVDLEERVPSTVPEPRRSVLDDARSAVARIHHRSEGRYLSAPTLLALARLLEVFDRLGVDPEFEIVRSYQPEHVGRFQLGLGVEISRLEPGDVAALYEIVEELGPAAPQKIGRPVVPREPSADPIAAWLFESCGFRTVQASDDGVFLSPIDMGPLTIRGRRDVDVGGLFTMTAAMAVEGTTGLHPLAAEALARLEDRRSDVALLEDAEPVGQGELGDALADIVPGEGSVPEKIGELIAEGLVDADSNERAMAITSTMRLEHAVGYWLDPERASVQTVIDALGAAEAAGFYSTALLWDPGSARLLAMFAVSVIPGGSLVDGKAPPAAYWWFATSIPNGEADDPVVTFERARSPQAVLEGMRPGLALVACVTYQRIGYSDPYEVRIELTEPKALMDLEQYGYVMNLLESLYPTGVEVNTFDLRRHHVDADGDGSADWLTSGASRSYQRYQQRKVPSAARWSSAGEPRSDE